MDLINESLRVFSFLGKLVNFQVVFFPHNYCMNIIYSFKTVERKSKFRKLDKIEIMKILLYTSKTRFSFYVSMTDILAVAHYI